MGVNKTVKKNFVTLVSLFVLSSANASVFEHEASLDKIANELPELKSIECKFIQEKQFSNLVLKSSGDFTFEKGKGVIFYTTYPVKSVTSYTSREYRQINNVITAISNKSYSRLQKDFKFFFEKKEKGWTLALMPKQDTSAYNYLKSIEINGRENIDKIVILTCDKTKTTIWFQS